MVFTFSWQLTICVNSYTHHKKKSKIFLFTVVNTKPIVPGIKPISSYLIRYTIRAKETS
jgi:hypothetical protein